MFCYFVSFLDRVNVGFAALQMVKDLHMSPTVFGFGGGIFFVSYFLFEVPSNLLLEKLGARLWIARIMITWGFLAAGTAFVVDPKSFYTMRLLLGAAEAGFFPGVILYLTYWFPSEYRARIVGMFTVAIPVSSFLGSPISAALLGVDGWLGLRGWQWMFIMEGAPAVLLGLFCLFYVASSLRRRRPPLAPRTERILGPVVGLGAGMFNGSLGASGPVVGSYLHAIGLYKRQFAFAISSVFVLMGIVRATSLALLGAYTASTFLVGWMTDLTHSTSASLYFFAGLLAVKNRHVQTGLRQFETNAGADQSSARNCDIKRLHESMIAHADCAYESERIQE